MDLNKKINQWIFLLAMSFIWGTSFILIKKSLLAYTPIQSGALRISFAFIYFLPIAISRIKKLDKKNAKFLIIIGLIGNFFPAFMFAFGETRVSSSIASMLNSITPIFVLLIGILFFKSKATWLNIIGLVIGFVGTLGLISANPANLLSGWNIGAVIILVATLFYGINTNILKFKLKELDGLSMSALSFMFIGPFALSVFFSTDIKEAYLHPDFWKSTISLAILAFFSSFIAVILFNWLIKYSTPIFAASSTYIIPVFAIFWGILDGETLTLIQIISIIIVFVGVSFINNKKPVIKNYVFKLKEKISSDRNPKKNYFRLCKNIWKN